MASGAVFEQLIRESIEGSIATKQRLLGDSDLIAAVSGVVGLLIDAFRANKKVLLFGIGGSAADAQHIAAEFVGRFAFDRAALPALALSVNTSCLTAIGNDYGFDLVFSRQVEAFGHSGDTAIGISTSGNSPNVIHALSVARKMGLHTVALTGHSGGKLKNVAEYCICVPSNETPRIQECHIVLGHIISGLVERAVFMNRAVFLDRDGVINRKAATEDEYVKRWEEMEILPGTAEAISWLNRHQSAWHRERTHDNFGAGVNSSTNVRVFGSRWGDNRWGLLLSPRT